MIDPTASETPLGTTSTTASAATRPSAARTGPSARAGLTELGTPIPAPWVPRWGFHTHNELLNGRLAMLGFVALVAVEWFLGHGLLIWN